MFLSLVVFASLQSFVPRLAADLTPGLELRYSSGGREAPPWIVDSVHDASNLMPDAAVCARFTMRRAADQAPSDTRLCLRRDTLFAWDARRSAWAAQRPVGANMTFVQPRANGDTVRYTTDALTSETISGMPLHVTPTTVLTVDSLGRAKRRLRERYALSLATATGGVFEVPDPDVAGSWRQEQVFELTRLARKNR